MKRSVALLAPFALVACVLNPVSGDRELVLISEAQEIEMGRQGAAEVATTIGLHPDAALQSYVSEMGQALAARTERPQLAWEFRVVDDAAVNAFALPGGFVFVTRGLLTHMTNEAELASVLGHESGHVAARHSVQQMTRQQIAALGLGIGSVLSSTAAEFGGVAGAGLGLLFLKYSRDDETQADRLGFRYALEGGYDTREMIQVFEMLQQDQLLSGVGKLPEWQATHPDPGNRIDEVTRLVLASGADFGSKTIGADRFLGHLDGMVYGEDPRAGFFQEMLFVHPNLEFVLQFPDGWATRNASDAVTGVSADRDAVIQLRGAAGSPEDAARSFFRLPGLQAGVRWEGTVHGYPAVSSDFTATTEEGGRLRGIVMFIAYRGSTWTITAFTEAGRFASYRSAFQQTLGSFDRLTDPAALAVQPLRIEIARVAAAMSLEQFNSQSPSSIPLAELAMINGLTVTAQLRSGQPIKRVFGSPAPRVSIRP
jgi:predicted Zn-dependent protease